MRRTLGPALLLIAIVAVLYAPTLGYGWVYEDLNDPTRFLAPPTWAGMTDRGNRVLTTWTFGLSWLISPMEPWGYHLISVAVHALNTALLFVLASRVFAAWPAFVCATVFAVHPMQTESVAYISARADLVMTTCVILALVAAERERWVWLLAACVCAVLAKESGIVAGPLALLWAFWRDKRVPVWLCASSIVIGGVGASYLFQFYDLRGLDLSYTAQETAKVWHLIGTVALPIGLSIDHAYHWPAIVPPLALIGTMALGGYALLSSRAWAMGVLFVLIALSPRLLIPLVEGIHEHHFYGPMVGISLALVGSFQKGLHGVSETSA